MTDTNARRVLAIRQADETDETSHALDGTGEPTLSDVSPRYIRELARLETRDSIATLREIRDDTGQSANARIKCAEILLERGWGKVASEAEMLKVFLERNVAADIIEFVMPMNTDGAVLSEGDGKASLS